MNEDQKKIAIGIVLMLIPIVVFIILFFGSSENKDKLKVSPKHTKKIKKKHKNKRQKKTKTSSYLPSSFRPSRTATNKKDQDEINALHKSEERKLKKYRKKWLLAKINDESLGVKATTKYRLRLIKGYQAGLKAIDCKDFVGAMKHLNDALNDPMATPVAKYMILMYMRIIAARIGEFKTYMLVSEIQAKLIAEEDLSGIKIEKDPGALDDLKEFKEIIEAGQNPNNFRDFIDKKMADGVPVNERKDVEDMYREKINKYKLLFKGFFKNAS